MSAEQQVSDIYLKRENLKEAEAELRTAKEKLEETEHDLREAKKYCKYFIVSLVFLGPSFFVQDFKRIFLVFVGFSFLVHIILMDIGIGQVITVLFQNEKGKRRNRVREKKEVVETKKQELYNSLSKLSGKVTPDDKAVREKVLTTREQVWKKLKQIREEVDRENIEHTGWVDDKLLQDIVLTMPLTKEEFLQLPGSNGHTYQNFGEQFLEQIQGYYFSDINKKQNSAKNGELKPKVDELLSEKYLNILQMCSHNKPLQEIINQCKTSENELIKLINTDVVELEIEDLIPREICKKIRTAMEKVGDNNFVSIRQEVDEEINSNYINLMMAYESEKKDKKAVTTKNSTTAEEQAITNDQKSAEEQQKKDNQAVIQLATEETAAQQTETEEKTEENESEINETGNNQIMPGVEQNLLAQILTEFERFYQENKTAVQINKPQFKDDYFVNIDCDLEKLTQILTDCPLVYKVKTNCFAFNSWILLGLAQTVFATWERAKFIVIEIKVRDILGVKQINKEQLIELLADSDYFELKNNNRFVKFTGTVEKLQTSLQKVYQPLVKLKAKIKNTSGEKIRKADNNEDQKDTDQEQSNEEKKTAELEEDEQENKKVQIDPQNL